MNRAMITSANTINQLQQQLDLISNNMSNVQTTGFKRREASFVELLAQEYRNQIFPNREEGRLTPDGIRLGVGARLGQSSAILSQGNLQKTDRALDVAMTREGYFFRVQVNDETGEGIQLTRDGSFSFSVLGDNTLMLTDSSGRPIVDDNDERILITGTPTDIAISSEGVLRVSTEEGADQFATIGVVRVDKPQFLEQRGDNLWDLPTNFDELGVPMNEVMEFLGADERGQLGLEQGSLEQSNVDLQKEMTNLITTQRQMQFQSRAISMADQMMGLVNGIR
ncbi:flagellar hook-basal body protein [Bacillus fonticola]|uniref:flagellar hook-basal body protein n=1 Tax=Bacillus fonticola TaxID=2728853 RepID=UPI0014758525|nr:flagellar hook-basal body protein [Bacillus fonticola]